MPVSLNELADTKALSREMRPRKQFVLFSAALFLALAATVVPRLISDAQTKVAALPFSFKVIGLEKEASHRINITYTSPIPDLGQRANASEQMAIPIRGTFEWVLSGAWIKAVQLTASEDVLSKITGVDIVIGDQRISYSQSELSKWKRIPNLCYAINDRSRGCATVEMPPPPKLYWPVGPAPLINWPQTRSLMAAIVIPKLLFFLFALISGWIFWRAMDHPACREYQAKALGQFPVHRAETRTGPWLAAGFLVLLATLGIYFRYGSSTFTQDDNLGQFLPVVQMSSKALFGGQFPMWNPHQQLGAPTTTVGTYMLTYPPTYLSWWIAARIAGNEDLTMNVFCVLHLIAGYFVTYLSLRHVGIRPSLSIAGSLSFILSGFLLIAGRSQFTFIPLAIFAPPLLMAPYYLVQSKAPWKWALFAGSVIGVFFHAGHAQMWAYGVMFFVLEILLFALGGKLGWRRALWSLPALCFAFAIAAPLFLLQFAETHDMFRNVDAGAGLEVWRTLVPLGPQWWSTQLNGQPPGAQIFYAGTVFALAVFIGLWMLIMTLGLYRTTWKQFQELVGSNVFLITAGIALLLALGHDGLLWTLQSQLPVFDKFRWPMKYTGYLVPLMAVAGGLILERTLKTRSYKIEAGIVAGVSALLMLHCALIQGSWYDYGVRPYPKLPAEMSKLVSGSENNPPARVLTSLISMRRNPSAAFFDSLAVNFATKAEAYAAGGYDVFIENSPEYLQVLDRFSQSPLEAAKAYGIRWIIQSSVLDRPELAVNRTLDQMEMPSLSERRVLLKNAESGVPAFTSPDVTVYELKGASPYAFTTSQTLPVSFDASGANINISKVPPGTTVITNVLWRHWLKATLSGSPIPTKPDDWGRVAVTLPAAAQNLRITYSPPWNKTCLVGLACLILALLSGLLLHRFELKVNTPWQS
jgi:hypothetical protein